MKLKPLGVRDFINKFIANESFFDEVPEFAFIKPLASKVKSQNCTCGLGAQMASTSATFNEFVEELSIDTVNKVKSSFDIQQVCFAIQKDGRFEVKCY